MKKLNKNFYIAENIVESMMGCGQCYCNCYNDATASLVMGGYLGQTTLY